MCGLGQHPSGADAPPPQGLGLNGGDGSAWLLGCDVGPSGLYRCRLCWPCRPQHMRPSRGGFSPTTVACQHLSGFHRGPQISQGSVGTTSLASIFRGHPCPRHSSPASLALRDCLGGGARDACGSALSHTCPLGAGGCPPAGWWDRWPCYEPNLGGAPVSLAPTCPRSTGDHVTMPTGPACACL